MNGFRFDFHLGAFHFGSSLMVALVKGPEVAGVTFSDSDSVPSPKFLKPDPAILQI